MLILAGVLILAAIGGAAFGVYAWKLTHDLERKTRAGFGQDESTDPQRKPARSREKASKC